jgi:glycosyltransferase involved in cell wall biosynthesis
MNNIPQFSVVVPLFNKRAYIRRTIDSILAQSLTDFELIVVDDGSTDGSLDALADVQDSRIKIIQQANQGVGPARNTGMAVARAPWIAFIDADDAWLPDHLAELSRVAQAFPEAGLISTANVEAHGKNLPQTSDQQWPAGIGLVDYFLEASKRIGFINSSSSAVRRTVFTSLGGFNSRLAGEDLEYWARVALHHAVAASSRTTSVYFRDTGGVMAQLEAVHHSGPAQPIEHLSQLSSTVAMLLAHAQTDPIVLQQPGVIAYINSRIENGIKGALLRSDMGNARRLGKMLIQPASRKARLYANAAFLPHFFVVWLLLFYRLMKHGKYPSKMYQR